MSADLMHDFPPAREKLEAVFTPPSAADVAGAVVLSRRRAVS
jgi:hypothetical protein